ncbi:DUF5677 domain-containing protein [Streptomyces sp. URMC 129]|uniref:DUF5677 domain-containing protein n=1 Tax=Streptomyces sp. URMC 129 TaxID=3423407 RepID=UPI003F1DA277
MAPVTEQQYRQAVEKMVAHYRAAGPVETQQRRYRTVLIGHGWCAEVHRLAEAALRLVDLGYGHEAQILVRTMFETTISLHWLSQKGDAGALGVLAEGGRANRAAAVDLEKAFRLPQDLIDAIKGERVEKTEESEIFHRFQAQCDEIDPKRELYSVYRYLCGFAHPTSVGAFAFIEQATEPPGLRGTPRTSSSAVAATAAMCVLWAGRAFDEMIVGKPRKQFLRAVARDIGLPPVLPRIWKVREPGRALRRTGLPPRAITLAVPGGGLQRAVVTVMTGSPQPVATPLMAASSASSAVSCQRVLTVTQSAMYRQVAEAAGASTRRGPGRPCPG